MDGFDYNMDEQERRAKQIEMKKKKNPKVKGKQGQIFDSANYYLQKSKSNKVIDDEEKSKPESQIKPIEEAKE